MPTNYILTSDGGFVSEDELYHWGTKKGEQKKDHKYISREWKNGRWVYTYEEDRNNRSNQTFNALKKEYAKTSKIAAKMRNAGQDYKNLEKVTYTNGQASISSTKDKYNIERRMNNLKKQAAAQDNKTSALYKKMRTQQRNEYIVSLPKRGTVAARNALSFIGNKLLKTVAK